MTPHNPDKLTNYGQPEWRLLDEDEVRDGKLGLTPNGVEFWNRWIMAWDASRNILMPSMTYRTRLTRAELRAARGLPVEEAKVEDWSVLDRLIPAPQELKDKMQRLAQKPPVSFEQAKAQTDAALATQSNPSGAATPEISDEAREAADAMLSYLAHTPTEQLSDRDIGSHVPAWQRIIQRAITASLATLQAERDGQDIKLSGSRERAELMSRMSETSEAALKQALARVAELEADNEAQMNLRFQLAARITELEKERDEAREAAKDFERAANIQYKAKLLIFNDGERTIDQLRADLAAARKDTERLDWIQSHRISIWPKEDIRTAIDAALGQSEKGAE